MLYNLLLVISLVIFSQQSQSQELKLSMGFGGGSANSEYLYNSIIGPYVIQGQYAYSANIAYPILGNGFGLFIESHNRQAEITDLSFNNNSIVAGLLWRLSFNSADVEILYGFGYGWDTYELTTSNTGTYTISNEMSLFHSGMTIYLPVFEMLDVMIGMRLSKNNTSHVSSSFSLNERDLKIPTVLYAGVVGLSFTLFGDNQ